VRARLSFNSNSIWWQQQVTAAARQPLGAICGELSQSRQAVQFNNNQGPNKQQSNKKYIRLTLLCQ
jgi:hypothetical protein